MKVLVALICGLAAVSAHPPHPHYGQHHLEEGGRQAWMKADDCYDRTNPCSSASSCEGFMNDCCPPPVLDKYSKPKTDSSGNVYLTLKRDNRRVGAKDVEYMCAPSQNLPRVCHMASSDSATYCLSYIFSFCPLNGKFPFRKPKADSPLIFPKASRNNRARIAYWDEARQGYYEASPITLALKCHNSFDAFERYQKAERASALMDGSFVEDDFSEAPRAMRKWLKEKWMSGKRIVESKVIKPTDSKTGWVGFYRRSSADIVTLGVNPLFPRGKEYYLKRWRHSGHSRRVQELLAQNYITISRDYECLIGRRKYSPDGASEYLRAVDAGIGETLLAGVVGLGTSVQSAAGAYKALGKTAGIEKEPLKKFVEWQGKRELKALGKCYSDNDGNWWKFLLDRATTRHNRRIAFVNAAHSYADHTANCDDLYGSNPFSAISDADMQQVSEGMKNLKGMYDPGTLIHCNK